VLTVSADRVLVESRLVAGGFCCPVAGCGGVLRGHGWGRRRQVCMGTGSRLSDRVWVRPRRARCGSCKVSQVLLDERCLSRRMDGLEVIGVAVLARAGGESLNRVACLVGRPLSTVRGWLASAVVACVGAPVLFGVVGERFGVDPGGVRPVAAHGATGFVQWCCWLVAGLGGDPVRWLVGAAMVCGGRVLQASWWQHKQYLFLHGFALPGTSVGPARLESGP